MADWKEIWKRAENAKIHFIQTNNFVIFEDLLKQYPNDGMVYYNLGNAYEERKEYDKALEAYQKAQSLFPMFKWRQKAHEGITRVQIYMKREDDSENGNTDNDDEFVIF